VNHISIVLTTQKLSTLTR